MVLHRESQLCNAIFLGSGFGVISSTAKPDYSQLAQLESSLIYQTISDHDIVFVLLNGKTYGYTEQKQLEHFVLGSANHACWLSIARIWENEQYDQESATQSKQKTTACRREASPEDYLLLCLLCSVSVLSHFFGLSPSAVLGILHFCRSHETTSSTYEPYSCCFRLRIQSL